MSNWDEKKIIEYIVRAPAPVPLSQIVRKFGVKGHHRRQFRQMLKELEQRGRIARTRGKNYGAPSGRTTDIIGKLEVTAKGFGFVRPDWSNHSGKKPFEGDLFIPPKSMANALDGDLVRAELIRVDREGPLGRITQVLEHAHKTIVGWYQRSTDKYGEVFPRNTRLDRRIRVPLPKKDLDISDFDWVEVEVQEFTDPSQPLVGEVVNRLGKDDDRGIDVLLVLRDKGILEEFPKSVEQEVADMHFRWEEDLEGRTDYRGLDTVTIDPETAKDYDDGLSVETIDSGWRLYVHIADVSHFVKPGTALDNEAYDRATSVYPVDRVVPMLPQKLSNYLCSLRPNEDRLTVTAVMDIDRNGRLLRKEFHSSVIHSNYRLTYEQVQAVFEDRSEEAHAFRDLIPTLGELRKVAAALRKTRFGRGALDLDIPEVKVQFDDAGAATDIKFYERYESHQLVEECMLIANEAVAQYLTEKEAPLLYRIHEIADQERLEKLVPALKMFGIKLSHGDKDITPRDIQNALDDAEKHPAGHILRRLILRALKRAEYDPENVGHFGLASDCYCHFTSPIRRYPDVIVHRQLKALEARKRLPYDPDDNDLDAMGEHTSSRERRAQEAEWESTEIKSLEYMKRHEGDEFDGWIASVHTWGIFIELAEHPVEGFIKLASLRGDRYDLDDTGVRLIGRHSGHVIKLADKIRVRIVRVDPFARQLDLELLDQPEAPKGRRMRSNRRYHSR